MSEPDWMKNQGSTNVADIVDTQNTQYAIEKASSALSDPAFQSFLTNAPIPRLFSTGAVTGTYSGGGATNVIRYDSTSSIFDPYNMFSHTTGLITIPIDGFYTISGWISGVGSVGSTARMYYGCSIAGALGIMTSPNIAGIGTYQTSATIVAPLRAGETVTPNIVIDGAAAWAGTNGALGLVWSAPYQNYVKGQ